MPSVPTFGFDLKFFQSQTPLSRYKPVAGFAAATGWFWVKTGQHLKVLHTPEHDYAYRAFVPTDIVTLAMTAAIQNIKYTNFKNSVPDQKRHDAYLSVWRTMAQWQRPPHRSTMQPTIWPLRPA